MRRADRLFEIIQVFRRARGPLTAAAIAAELETSKRTIYRDIAALIGQRVPIRGEAGLGYVLERGFDMPPLMLTADEIEAVVLGAQWVAAHADPTLAAAARATLAKVAAVVPEELRAGIEEPAVATPPVWRAHADARVDIARVRAWVKQGRKLAIRYVDEAGRSSERTIWPFLVGYFDATRIVAACASCARTFGCSAPTGCRPSTFWRRPIRSAAPFCADDGCRGWPRGGRRGCDGPHVADPHQATKTRPHRAFCGRPVRRALGKPEPGSRGPREGGDWKCGDWSR